MIKKRNPYLRITSGLLGMTVLAQSLLFLVLAFTPADLSAVEAEDGFAVISQSDEQVPLSQLAVFCEESLRESVEEEEVTKCSSFMAESPSSFAQPSLSAIEFQESTFRETDGNKPLYLIFCSRKVPSDAALA